MLPCREGRCYDLSALMEQQTDPLCCLVPYLLNCIESRGESYACDDWL
jgi:hypothetical protein